MQPSIADQLVELARREIAGGEMDTASAALAAAMRLEPANLSAHNLLERHRLAGNFTEAFGVPAVISEDDDIFRFFANHPSSRNPVRDYLADGWRTLSELMRLLESVDCKLSSTRRFLEFASGFGRFTRHLVTTIGAERVVVSDVVAGSVDFLRSEMGVSGFYSAHSPAELELRPDFDLIVVLSLFSHLPATTWSPWLERLYGGLGPGGSLVITTHGEKCAMSSGIQLPPEGFFFVPESESQALPGHEYGCTFTSREYVFGAISRIAPEAQVAFRPAHFWGNQDAFVIRRMSA